MAPTVAAVPATSLGHSTKLGREVVAEPQQLEPAAPGLIGSAFGVAGGAFWGTTGFTTGLVSQAVDPLSSFAHFDPAAPPAPPSPPPPRPPPPRPPPPTPPMPPDQGAAWDSAG